MMKARIELILAALAALSGCASLRASRILGWKCVHLVQDGEMRASSWNQLSLDGTPSGDGGMWEWRRRGPEATVTVENLFGGNVRESGNFAVWISLRRRLRNHFYTVEVGRDTNHGPTIDRAWSDRGRMTSYRIAGQLDAFLQLPRPVFVRGYDGRGRLAFRIPIDVDAVVRAIAAAERARAVSLGMTRNYRTACELDREDNRSIVMT
jgi:hypothetical protein